MSPSELAEPERHALGIGPFGSDLKVSHYAESGVPLIFVRNIRAEDFDLRKQPHIGAEKAKSLAAHRVCEGDVLITKMGEPPGDSAVYPTGTPEGRMTADCIRLRVNRDVATAKFVMYATRSHIVRTQIVGATKGVAQKKISLQRYKAMQYPVPPLPQQHRIVAAIETHFSRLDAAVASLTRAKANVKRARASVLKAAVEGRLVPTEAELARAEGRDYESASTLLARILAERKAAWTASGAKGKYKEPVAPDLRRLAVLPAGWCWTTLDAAAPLQPGFAFPSSRFQSTGIRLVKGINVRDGWMSEESVDFWPASDVDHLHRYWLRTEDVVLAMDRPVYSSGSKSTKVAMLDRRWDRSLLLQRVGCFRRATGLAPRYLFAFLRADSFRMHLIGSQKGSQDGKDLPHVSGGVVDSCSLPLPPLAEQHRIVAEVDRQLSVLDALAATIDANLVRCAKLRQSILKRAFEGRLVPAHVPTDTSALPTTQVAE